MKIHKNPTQTISFYQNIFAHSSVGVGVYDSSGQCIEANDALGEIIGAQKDQLLLQNYNHLDSWKESGLYDAAQKAVNTDEKIQKELIFTSSFGKTVTVNCHIVPFSEAGEDFLLFIVDDLSGVKKVESALRESDEKFCKAFYNSPLLMGISDIETGEYLDVNDQFVQVTGYSKKEVIGKTSIDLGIITPAIRNTLKKEILDTGHIRDVEITINNKNGDDIECLCSGEIILIAGKKRFLIAINDITERKQAERALQESEECFRHLSEASFEGIVLHNKGIILYANDQYYQMFGYTPEELAGKNAISLTSSPDSIQLIADKISQGDLGPYEVMGLKKNGIEFPIEIRVRSSELQGRTIRMAAIRDLTDRKRAEEKLRESEEHYRNFFDNALVGLFRSRLSDGLFLEINSKAAEQQGLPVDDIVGKVKSSALYRDPDQRKELVAKLKDEGEAHGFEADLTLYDGRDVTFSISVKAYPEQNYMEGAVIDITKSKQAEKEKTRLESQLRQAQKMEAIGTLAGGIAHDFNNILSAVIGFSELAKIDINNPQALEQDLDEILKGANRAKELVQQILAFSRKNEQQLKPIRIQLVIQEVLKLLRSTIPATIEIRQNIIPDCQAVLADPAQIHQVIMNLCTNAYHAMREKGGILSISCQPVFLSKDDIRHRVNFDPGAYVKIEVSDTGIGMSEDVLEKIFEPYYTTKASSEGTGLGLAVVHGIISGLHGEITAHSEPGKGTTFQIFLPTVESTEKIQQLDQNFPLPTGHEHILLIDDDKTIVRLNTTMLERLGYTVTAFVSSIEAINIFKKNPERFDLVVTDMTMPQMTGSELSQQILAIRPEIPIILCTGYSDLINEGDAKAMGIVDFVMKPVKQRNFTQTIRKALDAFPPSKSSM